MDLQYWPLLSPKRVMMINPLTAASQMAAVKILSGTVLGMNQLIDMILLVYSNEIPAANEFIQELIVCNFGCLNKIVATSDLPSITDADIFCCMTNFPNPNRLNFDKLDTDAHFDSFYLYIKVAQSLGKAPNEEDELITDKTSDKDHKPIIIGDGLIVLDIIKTMGNLKTTPRFFSPATIPSMVKTTLSDYLKVRCQDINLPYVWGANDKEFHVEIDKPYVIYDKVSDKNLCNWEMVSPDVLGPLNLDSTEFNASWMKKEFIEKLRNTAMKNPFGPIYKAWQVNKCLRFVWEARKAGNRQKWSMGVISDGSIRTKKGLPYILPIIFAEDGSWKISRVFTELPHVRQELKRFNNLVEQNHDKLKKYCQKFLVDNIINQAFVPVDEESESIYSSVEENSSNIPQ